MDCIITFIDKQIKTYEKDLTLEFIFGNKINSYSFQNTNIEESSLNKIIKEFRNYKLGYSQGKIYKLDDKIIKTYNNKNTEIYEKKELENSIVDLDKFSLLLLNMYEKKMDNMECKKTYYEEYLYDELTVLLNEYLVLVFYNFLGENHIKFKLNIEKNICLKNKKEIYDKINESIMIIQNNMNN